MVLSRFWLTIFISSIVFIVVSLFTANTYTIDSVLNGKKDDPILVSEKYVEELPAFLKDSIKKVQNQAYQLQMFAIDDPVLEKIRDMLNNLDVNTLTPVEALMKLDEIQRLLKN